MSNFDIFDVEKIPTLNFDGRVNGRVICWISGGVASAIASFKAFELFGDRCEFIFCDTSWEHPDTFRFIADYEKTLGVKVKVIKSHRFDNPEQVWRKYLGMNFAHGAPCSTTLKREVRIKEQDLEKDFCQVFGFDYGKKEINRAKNFSKANPELTPIYPLIHFKMDRDEIFKTLGNLGITPPDAYKHFLNNNCIGDFKSSIGGCVQGGIGYWQKIKKMFPHKYDYMAKIEHELSEQKGKPVTICKDQRAGKKGNRLFLKANWNFPEVGTIDEIKGRQPVTVFECNGFCGTED